MRPLIILIAFVLVLTARQAFSQSTFTAQYAINFPLGNTADYIGATSFRGISLDYRYNLQPNIAIGVGTGWYTFYEQKDYGTYNNDDGSLAISGLQYRYINSAPILFVGDYYFSPEEKFSPFVGLGIGITYNEVRTQMSQYYVNTDSWQFSLAPEVGVMVAGTTGVSGFLSARYNSNFKTSELDAQSYLTLNVGVMFGR
ncbi:MAG TPA: outer membrane beta-barrel protein [Chryseolinea sp.]|nr:outer membrane beta-barrel protein [Chryseolinea sp.]